MTIAERIVSTKPCTTCGAKVGEWCRDSTGAELAIIHVARTEIRATQPKRKK